MKGYKVQSILSFTSVCRCAFGLHPTMDSRQEGIPKIPKVHDSSDYQVVGDHEVSKTTPTTVKNVHHALTLNRSLLAVSLSHVKSKT